MIGYLSGQTKKIGPNYLILVIGGVGYKVFVPLFVLEKAKSGEELELEIHTHVKEDQLDLYGFKTSEELGFFELLLSVSGVGPKMALNILSLGSLSSLKDSIAKKDPTLLQSVSGVGRKIAEKIVVELKSKIGTVEGVSSEMFAEGDSKDVLDALIGLGITAQDAKKALSELPDSLDTTEEKIKYALKNLGNK